MGLSSERLGDREQGRQEGRGDSRETGTTEKSYPQAGIIFISTSPPWNVLRQKVHKELHEQGFFSLC